MHEPYALKGARTVPGRGEGGNTLSLFDRAGRARGGNPLPGKENHTGPPTGFPRRSGGSRGKSPGGAQP